MSDTFLVAAKFMISFIALTVGLDLVFNATLTELVTFSFFITLFSYIITDRFLLPRMTRSAALMSDFLIAYLSVWIFGIVFLNSYLQIAWGSVVTAIILSAGDLLVYRFFTFPSRQKETDRPGSTGANLSYQTEFAEEPDKDHD